MSLNSMEMGILSSVSREDCERVAKHLRKMVETGWWREAPKKLLRAAALLEQIAALAASESKQ